LLEVCGLFFRIATLSGAAVKPVAAHNRATLRGGMIAPGFGGQTLLTFSRYRESSGRAEAQRQGQ